MMERSWVGSRFQIEAHIACDSPGRVWGIWSKDFQGKIFHSLGWVWTLQMWHSTAIDFRSRDKPSGETEGKGRAFCHFCGLREWAFRSGPQDASPAILLQGPWRSLFREFFPFCCSLLRTYSITVYGYHTAEFPCIIHCTVCIQESY